MSSRALTGALTQSSLPTPILRIHTLQSLRLSKGHSRRVVVCVRASLWDLPETVQHGIQLGTGVAISLSVGLSLLPILTGDAKERNENRFNRPNADERADNIRWGVMSILAGIPFLNPMVRGKFRIDCLFFKSALCLVLIEHNYNINTGLGVWSIR